MAYRCQHNLVPEYLQNMYHPLSEVHQYNTRRAANLSLFVESSTSESGKGMFRKRSVILFNSLPVRLKDAASLNAFKRAYCAYFQN